MKILDWLRGKGDDDDGQDEVKPDDDWQAEEQEPADEDDPTAYPLW